MDRKIRWSAVMSLLSASLGLLIALGAPIDEMQQIAVLTFFTALGPIISTLTGYFTYSDPNDPSRVSAGES